MGHIKLLGLAECSKLPGTCKLPVCVAIYQS